ncbi:MAG: hypothetical protein QG657_977 [Acidobacteriota bacterium]|nr:hypothetical protein [Acidobacteriota bacterium]
MEITKDIKDTMSALSEVNLDFLAFVEKNPGCLNRANFSDLEELRNRFHLLQPWPTFLSRERKAMFEEAGVKLFNLIKSIPERLFQNNTLEMSAYYALPVNVLKLQMEGVTKEHLDNLLARGDFIFSPSGLKCMEYNIAGNLGGHRLPLWESLYLKNPLVFRFLKEYSITIKNRNLLEQYLAHCIRVAQPMVSRSDVGEVNIALVLMKDILENLGPMSGYLEQLYRELLRREYPSLSGDLFLCDFPHLDVVDDWVYYKGRKIHALTEWYAGVLPPHIMKAFKAGNIPIMNGPITCLMSSKLNLALLSEHADADSGFFSPGEKEIIREYVPWSRKIVPGETTYRHERIRLEDFIPANKNTLVMKPSLGYGGDNVYLGINVPQDEWEKQVEIALSTKSWLVQELVESSPALYQQGENGCAPYDQTWGFFIFGSHYAGTFLRVMPKKDVPRIINTHQGAQISIVFDVDK